MIILNVFTVFWGLSTELRAYFAFSGLTSFNRRFDRFFWKIVVLRWKVLVGVRCANKMILLIFELEGDMTFDFLDRKVRPRRPNFRT